MGRRWTWMLVFLCASSGALGSGEAGAGAGGPLQALHCPPCERVHCPWRRALRLQCKGGVSTGVCGCCPACARTEGEACGGAWDYLGKCDGGLLCVHEEAGAERGGVCRAGGGPRVTVSGPLLGGGGGNLTAKPKQSKHPRAPFILLSNCGGKRAMVERPEPEGCSPECTQEYCQDHPVAICSARSVSVENRACRGSCLHTSCSSCLTLRRPSCPHACGPSDSDCLQRFGRCVHSHLRAPPHPVCHSALQRSSEGHFVCLLPACPDQSG
ncbi:unnamed protein product [Menidia menidia]|uniref:(Atlantic silverside) hypothetical protein n=1 Tax=Menidia menidia TaxID=238744 RepID=A0A8S4BFS7_9TELE|nr:unnamed protein product [Menidia menidia]